MECHTALFSVCPMKRECNLYLTDVAVVELMFANSASVTEVWIDSGYRMNHMIPNTMVG